MGDLSFEEAYDFYCHSLEALNNTELDNSKEYFRKVFSVTGGRMVVIEKYIIQASTQNEPILNGNSY